MEFAQVVHRRRMVRRFDPDRPVPEQVLHRALQHAIRAPSAGFSQGWDFVVLTKPAEREAFWASTTDPTAARDAWLRGVRTAPCLVVCCSDLTAYLRRYAEPDKGWTDQDEARWPIPYWDVDTGMAALMMLLTAVDEGLGALFFGIPAERMEATKQALDVPLDRRLVAVVAMGYAVPDRRSRSLRRGRRGLAEVAHRGRFGTPWSPSAAVTEGDQREAEQDPTEEHHDGSASTGPVEEGGGAQ